MNVKLHGHRRTFKKTRLSIVSPVLDSHIVVRRQILHYKKMNLPNDIEIIFIDDNSDPPLRPQFGNCGLKNFYIYPTGDTRLWSIACARNLGIKIAQGEYIFNADVDVIIPKQAIMAGYNFIGDKLYFKREFAILDNRGNINQDKKVLLKYGLSENHYKKYGVRTYSHAGIHVIKKKIIVELDGYPERTCEQGHHPTREDKIFYLRYERHCSAGSCKSAENHQSKIFCFPPDKMKIFHKLNKKTISRFAWKKYYKTKDR